jgi:hypothetical protein
MGPQVSPAALQPWRQCLLVLLLSSATSSISTVSGLPDICKDAYAEFRSDATLQNDLNNILCSWLGANCAGSNSNAPDFFLKNLPDTSTWDAAEALTNHAELEEQLRDSCDKAGGRYCTNNIQIVAKMGESETKKSTSFINFPVCRPLKACDGSEMAEISMIDYNTLTEGVGYTVTAYNTQLYCPALPELMTAEEPHGLFGTYTTTTTTIGSEQSQGTSGTSTTATSTVGSVEITPDRGSSVASAETPVGSSQPATSSVSLMLLISLIVAAVLIVAIVVGMIIWKKRQAIPEDEEEISDEAPLSYNHEQESNEEAVEVQLSEEV